MSDSPMFYPRDHLYFCDGQACEEYQKSVCYLYGGECHHTGVKEHALSLVSDVFPPTTFVSTRNSSIKTEVFDEESIFTELGKGKRFIMG